MTYDEHLELRNDLYQTSLKLFHSDIKWFSEYIPSVSKWRVKVMLREELRNFTGENDPNSNNKSTARGRTSGRNNLTSLLKPDGNSVNISNSEDSPSVNFKQSLCDTSDIFVNKEEISIKLPPKPLNSEPSNNLYYSNGMCTINNYKSDSGINNSDNACKINVDNNDELPVHNKLHVDNNKNNEINIDLKETSCANEEQKEKNELDLSINFAGNENNEGIEFNEDGSTDKEKNDRNEFKAYNILTGKDRKYFREKNSNISSFGLTLWEYLPLVAILSGCTGIFIIFRLSSAMYRYSVLSCTISHLVTFLFIGIPLSQLEFSMRKRGRRYGFLEAMQYFNPKYVGITILSLVTVVFIFLYSVQIISSLSVILYNISKKAWRITLEDTLICSRINNSILSSNGSLIDTIRSGNLTLERINYSYSLCSLSSMCNVVIPFFQDSNDFMNAVKSYTNITHSESGKTTENSRTLGKTDFELFMKVIQGTNNTNDHSYTPNFPTWCLSSPSKKLRNLMVLQQSGYQETIYFSLENSIRNPQSLFKTQIFPVKKPLKWINSNLFARIFGLSISFIFIILSINGGGKLYRIASFLSFLSLMTLFLTASIQIVANDIQLSIFISIIVTQEGIESLFSPAIWYCSINNTLLFFGISFLITMFPLKELIRENRDTGTSNSLNYEGDGFYDKMIGNNANEGNMSSISPIFEAQNKQPDKVSISLKEPRIGEITLRKHVSRMYMSVYNQEIEKSESKHRNMEDYDANSVSKIPAHGNDGGIITQNKHAKHNLALVSNQTFHEEHTNFPSLMSAANSAVFFLACVMISSIVVLISNAALISLSESTNTPLLLPYNEKFSNSTSTVTIKESIYNKIYKPMKAGFLNSKKSSYSSDNLISKRPEYLNTSKLFHENNWLMHDMFEPDSGHFQEIFQFFNGESASMEEISFLKNHMINWFRWNFIHIKSQSLVLGEFMIIYLIIIAIEVSKRIPSGVIVFFILVVFSFAISSACLCTSIISKHIFVIFNYWILPILSPKFGISTKDSISSNSKNKDGKNIRRLRKHKQDRNPVENFNSCDKYKKLEKIERKSKSKKSKKDRLVNLRKSRFSVIYKIKSFFKLIFCILSSFFLLLKLEIFKFIGISYRNKQNRKIEKMTFFVQFAFITLLMIMALLINIISAFIPRLPLDNMDDSNKTLQEQLKQTKTTFLNFSEKNELSKYHNNDIYVAKTFNIVFGSLFDIRIISNATNFMLALTAGIETIILTWYMYRDIQREIVGKNALKFQAIGCIISTILLSIGFLLGTKFIFVLFALLSLLNYLIFFIIARYFAKKNFLITHEQVMKRQKYSPTWWLYISNIDILRRKLNSKELEDAGSLTYCSEKSTIQVGCLNSDNNYNYCFNGSNNMNISQSRYFSRNEELIESISNFNLYCNVRSRQPLFISFWFIMAKYFSSILIFSTIPLSIASTLSLLFIRLDCLNGIISEVLLLNYISKVKVNLIVILNRVSIFQPIQVIIISLLILFGISSALIITLYIKFKQEKLRKMSKTCLIPNIQNHNRENQEINLNNILDDVYESLKVPKCAELYSNYKIENLGKMPQKLIISLAMLENHKLLNKYN
ncbi:large with 18 transmembrane domains [Cryptosporidium sp. chipmunk genotype I]|uniref:large with 18 transmembrane domains n=1 Tax=Cryptosporidium sp. chipmunk genotype I TaxID=1280935 RepID=UPI00351A2E50|nr:large with 18 transmembrane domains [Cryptosporidium sp. chipmunk genotype I]